MFQLLLPAWLDESVVILRHWWYLRFCPVYLIIILAACWGSSCVSGLGALILGLLYRKHVLDILVSDDDRILFDAIGSKAHLIRRLIQIHDLLIVQCTRRQRLPAAAVADGLAPTSDTSLFDGSLDLFSQARSLVLVEWRSLFALYGFMEVCRKLFFNLLVVFLFKFVKKVIYLIFGLF